jgi:hypothetical protein
MGRFRWAGPPGGAGGMGDAPMDSMIPMPRHGSCEIAPDSYARWACLTPPYMLCCPRSLCPVGLPHPPYMLCCPRSLCPVSLPHLPYMLCCPRSLCPVSLPHLPYMLCCPRSLCPVSLPHRHLYRREAACLPLSLLLSPSSSLPLPPLHPHNDSHAIPSFPTGSTGPAACATRRSGPARRASTQAISGASSALQPGTSISPEIRPGRRRSRVWRRMALRCANTWIARKRGETSA